MQTVRRKQQMSPQHKWTRLVHYLKELDKALVLQMRRDAHKPASHVLMEQVAVKLPQLGILGQILARVEELEQGIESPNVGSPHARNLPVEEPY